MYIKTFYELWLDLKICWFAVTRSSLQETRWSKKFFLMFIPKKKKFSHYYIILAMEVYYPSYYSSYPILLWRAK